MDSFESKINNGLFDGLEEMILSTHKLTAKENLYDFRKSNNECSRHSFLMKIS